MKKKKNKKNKAELLIRRRLANMVESYAAIVSLPTNDIKEYAKAAIRDIFIQMPSRSVNLNNWHGYKNYICEFFGENSYDTAMEELQKEGWLTKGDTRYEWLKMYGPVGTVPKLPHHLNEWADSIHSKKYDIYYRTPGSYPFAYDIKKYDIRLGSEAYTHGESGLTGGQKRDGALQGRVWTKQKILALWEYPDTVSIYKEMIEKLNAKLEQNKLKKIDASWKIDIPFAAINFYDGDLWGNLYAAGEKEKQNKNDWNEVKSYLIPVFDWRPEIMKNPKEYQQKLNVHRKKHMMSPVAKKTDVQSSIGSKKRPVDMTATQRHQMKSTSEGINEWADSIKTDNMKLTYRDAYSYPFSYSIKSFSAFFGTQSMTHSTLPATKLGSKGADGIIQGRIWMQEKIISLWEYPDNKTMFKLMIDKLNEQIETQLNNKQKIDSSWKIDIPYAAIDFLNRRPTYALNLAAKDRNEVEARNVKSYLIPIYDWSPEIMKNPVEYKKEWDAQHQKHIMSPSAKSGDVVANIGSKKRPADLTAMQRHQMKSASENINEWADEIHYKEGDRKHSLYARDDDALPFIYRISPKKTYFGDFGFNHDSMRVNLPYSKKGGSISGRLWADKKIISLWDYTDTKQEFMDMIDSINKELYDSEGFKIDSSWNIDIPIVESDYYNAKDAVDWLKDKYNESYLIPIFDWKPNIMKNPSLYQAALDKRKEFHTLSPIAKTSDVYAGVGSKKRASGFSPVQKYQLAHTSENKINENYIPKINDIVKIDGKWFDNNKERKGKIIDISPNKKRLKISSEIYPKIFSISTKNVTPIKDKINEIQTEYGCLMLKLEFPWWRNYVERYVKKEDIYNNAKQEFGYEYEPHVTILYGFSESVDIEKVKKMLHTLKKPISVKLTKIDIFSTKTFDVIKFDVASKALNKLNEIVRQNFEYTETHKDYKPHVTIAYVKPGKGEKYISKLKMPIFTASSTFIYSYAGGRKETFNVLKNE